MRKFLIKIFALIIALVTLVSCSENKSGIEIKSCELYKTLNGMNAKFEVINNEPGTIDNLSLEVETYVDSQAKESLAAEYSLYIESGDTATVTLTLPYECEKAVAVSYSYQTADGETLSGDFENKATAVMKETTTSAKKEIKTREDLAEVLLEDVKHQFMLQSYEANGYYDNQKKQFVIAAYATQTYADCSYSYSIEPLPFRNLSDSIAQMSQTCYEEFQNYGFADVQVSIGFMSSDEKIMISATNGEIVEMFD